MHEKHSHDFQCFELEHCVREPFIPLCLNELDWLQNDIQDCGQEQCFLFQNYIKHFLGYFDPEKKIDKEFSG